MKAIVENKLSPITSTKACAFSEIIVVVIDSRNETELRKGMNAVLGCPLKLDASMSDRPFVDWDRVASLFEKL